MMMIKFAVSPRPPGRAVADAVRSVLAPSTHGATRTGAERARHIGLTRDISHVRPNSTAARCGDTRIRYTAIPMQTVHGSRRSSQVGLTSPARRPGPVLHAGWTSGRDRIEGARQTAPGRASSAAGSSWRGKWPRHRFLQPQSTRWTFPGPFVIRRRDGSDEPVRLRAEYVDVDET